MFQDVKEGVTEEVGMAGRAGRWAGRWRTRTAVLGVLLLGLGVATALVLVRGAPGDGAIPAARPERAAEIGARDSGLPDRPPGTSPGAVLGAPCRPEPGWPGWWRCRVAGIGVSARSVRPDAAAGLYTRLAGPVGKPATGPAVCAAGRPEERAWSRPAAPARPVGRYRCRIDGRRAVIWWTDPSGLVARAVAPDADLGRLFGWWTRHAGV